MDKFDIETVKRSHNIVNIIGQSVKLKKTGNNYTGLCPFHAEKTPSFSVDEKKQFYYCFGCGASGDVIDFVMNYSGLEFVDAYKQLGGELELLPSSEIKKNIANAALINHFRLPPDHKQDPEKALKIAQKCAAEESAGLIKYRYKDGFFLPIITMDGDLINAVHFPDKSAHSFIAGGPSYSGFTPIKRESETWIGCVALHDGLNIAHTYNVNVAVCWTDAVLKYVCKWNHCNTPIIPALRECDDDWLAYEMAWSKLSDGKLKKMEVIG